MVVHVIEVPPLRRRPRDVLPLARAILDKYAPERTLELDRNARAALTRYSWPGNVRELRNVLVRAIALAEGDVIDASDLRFMKDLFVHAPSDVDLAALDQQDLIRRALEAAGGNCREAARLLGMSKSTLHDRMRRYGFRACSKRWPATDCLGRERS
jgi:two-component system response regulator HydG